MAVTYVTALASAALASVAGWLLIGSSLSFFTKATPESFRLSLLLIPLIGLGMALGFLLVGAGRFVAMGAINLIAIAVNLLATLLFVGLLQRGVDGALWALIASYAAMVALQTRALWRIEGGVERPRLADFRRVLSYGIRYYAARIGSVANVQIGLLMMAWLGTSVQIGLFAAASALISRVMVVPDSLDTALQPRVGKDVNGRPELVAVASRASFFLVGAGLAVLLATSGVLVPLLLSPAFVDAVPLLWLMAPGLWIKSATKPMTAYFVGVNRPEVVSLSTAAELAAYVISMPLAFWQAGLPGAALATSIGCALGSLVMLSAFQALTGLGPRAIWTPQRSDLERLRRLWARQWHAPVTSPGADPRTPEPRGPQS
jgi:O-antigen/teichoic acid export membrane protein